MKVRNILIGLLVVLMAFVFISCEDEPEEQVQPQPQPQPGPVDNTIYKLTATKGLSDGFYKYDKFVLDFNEEIYEGDTVSLLFRSSRDVYQVSIRSIDGDTKYVYEVGVDQEDKPYTLEDAGDGWTRLSYTFGEGVEADNFRVDLRLRTIVGDFVEIKNVFIGDRSIFLSSKNVDMETYGSVLPTFAETADHDWLTDPTYTVAYFTAKPHFEDDYPVMEAVVKGGKITKAGLSNDGYYIEKIELISEFHKDKDMVLADFDPETSTIDADTNLLVTWKGVDRTVTFETNGGTPLAAKVVENGQLLALTNEEQPERDLCSFGGWYTDSGLSKAFSIEATPITSDITLYAKWILAENARNVVIDLNTGAGDDDILANLVVEKDDTIDDEFKPGNSQYYPGFIFGGWYAVGSETEFDFDAPVTENVTVRAKWTAGNIAQLTSTYNYASDHGNFDKYRIKFTSGGYSTVVNEDDVLSFRYRSTTPITHFNVRGSNKWVYQRTFNTPNVTSYEVGDDGWISVIYTFPKNGTSFDDGGGAIDYTQNYTFYFDFIAYTIEVGDIIEIQGMALNNVELTIDSGNTQSGSSGTKPTYESIPSDYEWESHNVTFDYEDRTNDVAVEYGLKVTEPTDTAKEGLGFVGWFKDEEFTEPFDFSTRITEDITLYGKWIEAWNVTLHRGNGAADELIYAAKGIPMDEPRGIGNVGYFLDGWYTVDPSDPGFNPATDSWDFADNVEGNMDLYAKWVAPTKSYRFTAKSDAADKDRFQWVWSAGDVGVTEFKAGDTFTCMIKSTPVTGSALAEFRLRNGAEADIGYKYVALPAADEAGWMSLTVTFTEDKPGSGLVFGLYVAGHSTDVKKNDICEIKAVAFNGVEMPVGDMSYAIDADRLEIDL